MDSDLGCQPSLSTQYRHSVASYRPSIPTSHTSLDIEEEYMTIPEEYLQQKQQNNSRKPPKYKDSITTDEYDLENDNEVMTKQADQLLRILTNPKLFQSSESKDDLQTRKKKPSTKNSVNAIMAGMFQITGSVVAKAAEENNVDEEKAKVVPTIAKQSSLESKISKHITPHGHKEKFTRCNS